MRETKFIEQNKKKWTEFEKLLKRKERDPDRLNKLFVEITDDLSYSRTFYPNRSVRYYLNGLAQSLFFNIYKNRRGKGSRLVYFWKEELPQIIWESRREFLIAFVVFALAFGIGMLSCAMDIEFPRAILGDAYVDMTEENIASGDPMKVYKEQNEVDMFLGIALNNLRVSFLTFISGLIAAIGTIGVLIYNGIMVGAFQYFFIEKGVFMESFLTVWIHGTLEISAIIIAGASGLVLGKGLIFPGTYSRLQAFQISARRGIKILMGIVPIIVAAAFLEGFLTRHTETPDIMRLAIILLSLFFILSYFVWYPRRLARRGFSKPLEDEKLLPTQASTMNYKAILSVGEIFKESFSFIVRHLRLVLLIGIILAALYVSTGFFLKGDGFLYIFRENTDSYLYIPFISALKQVFIQLSLIFNYSETPYLFIFNVSLLSLSTLWCGYMLLKETDKEPQYLNFNNADFGRFALKHFINILVIMLVLNVTMFIPNGLGFFLFLAILPICGLWLFVSFREDLFFYSSLGRTFYLLGNGWGKMYGLSLITLLVTIAVFLLVNSTILWFYFEVIQWNFDVEKSTMKVVAELFTATTSMFMFNIILPLIIVSMGLLYFSLKEAKEANGLMERIENLGTKRRAFGLETES